MKSVYSIGLLLVSNLFMTMAWYGHLKIKEWGWMAKSSLFAIILVSWGLAFFEYCFQVPANRIGFRGNGGPFSLFQLKVVQEVITLVVFVLFARVFFGGEQLTWNHAIAGCFLVGAVYFAFR
ncbi:MAG TPA: DMT family protein [Flavisolibacter sp.]